MLHHFGALVISQGFAHGLWNTVQVCSKALECGIGAAISHLGQNCKAALALNKCADGAGIARPFDQVALPMAEQFAAQNMLGALMGGDYVFDAAAPILS